MADHPLRPATDRRLGEPLPHQLANPTSAALSAQGPKVPCFPPQRLCGISTPFEALSPSNRHVPMHYSPVRHSPPGASTRAAVRLACVKHAASVQSEPGSNSSVQSLQILLRLTQTLRESNDSLIILVQALVPRNKRLHLSVVILLKSSCFPTQKPVTSAVCFASFRFLRQQQRGELYAPPGKPSTPRNTLFCVKP